MEKNSNMGHKLVIQSDMTLKEGCLPTKAELTNIFDFEPQCKGLVESRLEAVTGVVNMMDRLGTLTGVLGEKFSFRYTPEPGKEWVLRKINGGGVAIRGYSTTEESGRKKDFTVAVLGKINTCDQTFSPELISFKNGDEINCHIDELNKRETYFGGMPTEAMANWTTMMERVIHKDAGSEDSLPGSIIIAMGERGVTLSEKTLKEAETRLRAIKELTEVSGQLITQEGWGKTNDSRRDWGHLGDYFVGNKVWEMDEGVGIRTIAEDGKVIETHVAGQIKNGEFVARVIYGFVDYKRVVVIKDLPNPWVYLKPVEHEECLVCATEVMREFVKQKEGQEEKTTN